MLAKDYDGRNPTGLWVSEKLDGVRAYWDGNALWTRAGNRINCPTWFTAGLPDCDLDGELWAGRGKFQTAKGIAQSRGRDAEWHGIQFAVFDAPGPERLEERLARLVEIRLPEHAFVVKQTRCDSSSHLATMFGDVKFIDGEGLMLRIPGGPYLNARSAYWMKVKRPPNTYMQPCDVAA